MKKWRTRFAYFVWRVLTGILPVPWAGFIWRFAMHPIVGLFVWLPLYIVGLAASFLVVVSLLHFLRYGGDGPPSDPCRLRSYLAPHLGLATPTECMEFRRKIREELRGPWSTFPSR